MEVTYWDTSKLAEKVWADNPRQISVNELNNLRRLIAKFGMILPVICNAENDTIVGGHQRIRAAMLEGLAQVPVHTIRLADNDHTTLALALGKIEGDWDYDKLSQCLNELAATDAIDYTGFSEAELISFFAGNEEQGSEDEDDEEYHLGDSPPVTSSSVMRFRSPRAEFSCSREEYDALVHQIQRQVGLNDRDCTAQFANLLGF